MQAANASTDASAFELMSSLISEEHASRPMTCSRVAVVIGGLLGGNIRR